MDITPALIEDLTPGVQIIPLYVHVRKIVSIVRGKRHRDGSGHVSALGCARGLQLTRPGNPEGGARLAVVEEPALTNRARYDRIAEWYLSLVGTSPGLICDPTMGVMADRLDRQRWLDAACGAGRTSRELAPRGGLVVGVDVSEYLIALAEQAESSHRLGSPTGWRTSQRPAPGGTTGFRRCRVRDGLDGHRRPDRHRCSI